MSSIELLIAVVVVVGCLLIFTVNFLRMSETDLSRDFIETAIYSGLWKTSLHKIYSGNSCLVISPEMVDFKRASDSSLSKLEVRSFRWVKSGTYGKGTTIEPILFKVGGK